MDAPPLDFVAVTRDDFALISRWLAEPAVEHWWHDDPSPAAVERQFGPSVDGTDPTQVFVAYLDRTPVGLIQRYCLDDEPQYGAELRAVCDVPVGALSLDYFLGEQRLRGHGLGTRMISELVAASWPSCPGAGAVIVPVAAANRPSWRALERAGFRRVAEGELTPDNPAEPRDHVIYRIDRPVRL